MATEELPKQSHHVLHMKHKSLRVLMILSAFLLSQPHLFAEETVDNTKHDPAEYLSNTLPVLYISTVDETPIVNTEDYIEGSYYLDANGCEGYESIGTVDEPLPLTIKGRGNASWRLPKKPYRLKLNAKASMLGMPKSKHWVLMAAYADWLAHGRDYLNFKISEKLGMPYTTRCAPCEVVLNGDYIGMYFLTEQIRIDKDRVNIKEQDDEETDSTKITGGWLLEIDNYQEESQIRFVDPKKPNQIMKVTYHNPEVLSNEQLNYLTDLINNVNESVNTDDKTSREWEKYIDIDAIARFYILLEAIDDQEGFSGSCWFSKERGDSTKLIWGPFWDSGSTLGNRNYYVEQQSLFYENEPSYAYNHWIGEIAKFPRFQVAIKKWWKKYRDEVFPTMQDEVDAYGQLTEAALASDFLRWDDASATQLWYYRQKYMTMLNNKRTFLISKWDVPADTINWATYYSDIDLALPEGVNAYVVSDINDDGIEASPVQYIPANVGVLLSGGEELTEFVASTHEGLRDDNVTPQTSSLLVGSTEAQVVNDGYVIHNNMFVLAPADTPIEPNQCYIPVNSDDNTPTTAYVYIKDDTHTSINGTLHDKTIKNVRYYNITGVMSDNPFLGVNIVVKEMNDGTIETSKIIR